MRAVHSRCAQDCSDGRGSGGIAAPSRPSRHSRRRRTPRFAQPLAGTEGATNPFWSDDGRQLAFVADRKLKRIDASGGPTVTLYDGARPYSRGTWNRDNVILFLGDDAILRISAAGGPASPVSPAGTASLIGVDSAPFFLPDGRRFLYSIGAVAGGGIYVASLDSREATKLLDGAVLPTYADGFLVFGRDNTLFAQRFDPDRQQLSGNAVPLVHQLQMGGAPSYRATYAVSESGVSRIKARLASNPRSSCSIEPGKNWQS